LASTVGSPAALTIYLALVQRLLSNLNALSNVQLRYTPDDAATDIVPWLQPGWESRPQGAGDLGLRMERAFHEAHAAGIARVALIGSDCPRVTISDVRQAWANLDNYDLVLGPATDGGYWLIALQKVQPALFRDIPWSTNQVLGETLRRARALGLRILVLRELADVDTEVDWKAFQASRPIR
jgi:rSAM/selenodomain-associated transferase 1